MSRVATHVDPRHSYTHLQVQQRQPHMATARPNNHKCYSNSRHRASYPPQGQRNQFHTLMTSAACRQTTAPGEKKNTFTVHSCGITHKTTPQSKGLPTPPSAAQQRPFSKHEQWWSLQALLSEAMRYAHRVSVAEYRRAHSATHPEGTPIDPTQLEMHQFQLECAWGNLINDINDSLYQMGPDAEPASCLTFVSMLELFQRYSTANNATATATTTGSSNDEDVTSPSNQSFSIESDMGSSTPGDMTPERGGASGSRSQCGLTPDGSVSPELTPSSPLRNCCPDEALKKKHSNNKRPPAPPTHVPLEWSAVLRDDIRKEIVEGRRQAKMDVLQRLPAGCLFH